MKENKKHIEAIGYLLKYKDEFDTVYHIIATHRKRVVRAVNNESMSMVWEVGGFTDMHAYRGIAPFETAQTDDSVIVPIEMAQIPHVLFATRWTIHQIIMNRWKSDAGNDVGFCQ